MKVTKSSIYPYTTYNYFLLHEFPLIQLVLYFLCLNGVTVIRLRNNNYMQKWEIKTQKNEKDIYIQYYIYALYCVHPVSNHNHIGTGEYVTLTCRLFPYFHFFPLINKLRGQTLLDVAVIDAGSIWFGQSPAIRIIIDMNIFYFYISNFNLHSVSKTFVDTFASKLISYCQNNKDKLIIDYR